MNSFSYIVYMEKKICTKCLQSKNESEFYKHLGKSRSECKICQKERNKKYLSENKDRHRENSKKWASGNKDSVRFYFIKRTYGITKESWLEMLKKQENKCAICKTEGKDNNFFHTDHCHTSNKVRGLLCRDCNLLLGNAKDNKQVLKNAISYLGG